jgi:hypothetical protein
MVAPDMADLKVGATTVATVFLAQWLPLVAVVVAVMLETMATE